MRPLLLLLLSLLALPVRAQVDVAGAWVRPTVEGQLGTGAFMTLRSREPLRLVGASSAVAGVVEIHEMALQNNVMRMRAIEALPPQARRILLLARVEGRSHKEIARALDLAPKTVENHLGRAVARLAELLGRRPGGNA